MLCLDEEADHLRSHAQAQFDSWVEAVRAGTIFAHDGAQYRRWRSSSDRRAGRRPEGKNLAQLAHDFGGQVIVGGFQFKEAS